MTDTAQQNEQEKLQSEAIMLDKAGKARKKLTNRDYLFFGTNLYKYKWAVDMNCPEEAGAYIMFKNLGTGDDIEAGTIFLNGKLVRKTDFTHNHLSWFLLHELLHILNGHGLRLGNKNHMMWNFATDHVINSYLKAIHLDETNKQIQNVLEPYGGFDHCVIIPELEKEIPNATAEEAYDWIMKNQPQFEVVQYCKSECGDSGGENGQGQDGDNDGDGGSWIKIRDKKTGREYVVAAPRFSKKDKKAIREARSDARAMSEQFKDRGLLSEGLSRYLEEILSVEIPWDILLEKAIKQTAVPKLSGRSWRNLNKNFIVHNLTLAGPEYDFENEGVGTMIIGVDTSGSISKQETQQFASIIMESVKYFKNIRVFVHDVDVHQDLTYDKDNILEFGDMLKDIGFLGGGGTSHGPLFKHIEEMYDEDPDEVSMVISLTDGYSDVENVWSKYIWSANNHVPTFFVITSSGRKIQDVPGSEFEQIKINGSGEAEVDEN